MNDTRNTAVLVGFTAVTNLADGVTKVTLPLLATTLTSSPLQLSGVSLTLTLPWLLAALHVGVLVDRVDRRKLLWLANAARIAVVATLLLTGTHSLPLLYAAGITLGLAEVVALTAAAALVPDAVGPAERERVNAWVAGAETVCNEFCGPFVGGLLVAASTSWALGVTGFAYVLGVAALLLLAGRFGVVRTEPKSVHDDLVEGLKVLWRNATLRMMALTLAVLCACWGAWLALMPLVATTVMRLDPQGYGLLLSALGVGGLVGALVVTTLNRWFGRRAVMLADLIGTLAMVAVPAFTTNAIAVGVAAFAGGLGGTLWTVNARTIAQDLVPGALMGRYSAAAKLFSWGALPVGAGLAGVLAEIADHRVAFAVFAVATAAAIPPFLRTSPDSLVRSPVRSGG